MSPLLLRGSLVAAALLAVLVSGCGGSGDARSEAAGAVAGPRTTQTGGSGTDIEPAEGTPVSSLLTTTTATAAPTTSTTTTLAPITIAFAGDTSFTHSLADRDPLGEVADLLGRPDLTVVNLETTVAESGVGTAAPKRFVFKSPPKSVGLLSEAGIDLVQLANNHTLDYGRSALLRTLELLDEGGIAYVGAGADPAAAYAPVLVDVAGWQVAFVAFSRVPCDWSASGENTRPEVAWTCPVFEEGAANAVEAAAATGADIVVAMVHWGIELDHCPQQYQWDLATDWMERGADLVIGGHPHVLQGVSRVDGGWLVHSTGNFAFPSARERSSYTATFEFTFSQDAASELVVHPIRIVDGRPVPAGPTDRSTVLDGLSRWSFGVTFDDEGVATPTEATGACS